MPPYSPMLNRVKVVFEGSVTFILTKTLRIRKIHTETLIFVVFLNEINQDFSELEEGLN